MKFNHDEYEKMSKELYESLNDDSIKLSSSHFDVFNINSFIIFNKNYDTENNRVMDLMLYLLDYASEDGKIDPLNEMDELLLMDETTEEESNKIKKAIWFIYKIIDKLIHNDYKIEEDFIKFHDINDNYALDCKLPLVLLGLSSYYSRNASNDYRDYLNKLTIKFDYDFNKSKEYYVELKKYLKNKKSNITNVLIGEESFNKLYAKLSENEIHKYLDLLKEYEVKDKAEKIEKKYLCSNIKKLSRDKLKIKKDQYIMVSNGLISEMSEMMMLKRERYDDIDLVIIYGYLLSSVSEEVLIDYKKLNLVSDDFVFDNDYFDNGITQSCIDFINDINNFSNISNEYVRFERIANYYVDFKNELINNENSILDKIEDRNQKIVSSFRNAIMNGNVQLVDRNKILLFDKDVYYLGTLNGICDVISKLYYIDLEETTPIESVFFGLKNILDDDLYNEFKEYYDYANDIKKRYEIRPENKMVNNSSSKVEIFINGLIFTLVIMLIIVGIIGYIII